MNNKTKIALIGYPPRYYHPEFLLIADEQIEFYWVCQLQSDARYLLDRGVPSERILDLQQLHQTSRLTRSDVVNILEKFESEAVLRFNNIIMMDRWMPKRNYILSQNFLAFIAVAMENFFLEKQIACVSSFRDTSINLTAMLVCQRINITYVVPTRWRIPRDLYFFCSNHFTDSIVRIAQPNQNDILWAKNFLAEFRSSRMQPPLKVSTRSFRDVYKMLPNHMIAFLILVGKSWYDRSQSLSRYTVLELVKMYIRRRYNLLVYKTIRPASGLPEKVKRFCLYTLHTQPESSVDVQAALYSDQINLIKSISRGLPVGLPLFVKVHPTDVDGKDLCFYKKISQIPNVYLIDFGVDTRNLITNAEIVFALTGTAAYEAALLGRAVITFTKNFFNAFPTVYYVPCLNQIADMVDKIVNRNRAIVDIDSDIIRVLAELKASSFVGEFGRNYGSKQGPLTEIDRSNLKSAYKAVVSGKCCD